VSPDRQQYRVELDAGLGGETSADAERIADPDSAPFRIALIGDFSGRSTRGIAQTGRSLTARRPVRVDRDNVDDAIARVAPEIRVPMGSDPETPVQFAALDDFHPDRLVARLPRFGALREVRDRAASPSPIGDGGRQQGRASTGRAASGASVLDQILGDVPAPPGGAAAASAYSEPSRTTQPDALTDFVRRAVAPHVVADTRPSQPERVVEIDDTIASELRALLHHPDFQSVEAAWRTVDFLVRRLDTDSTLQVHLVDVSKVELALEPSAAAPGDGPWALLVALFSFGPDAEDVALLARLAEVARGAGASLVASADARFVGSPSFGRAPDPEDWSATETPEWDALRRQEIARHLGLAMPRFLLRLPYGGRDGEPCEVPGFAELSAADAHDEYLWGSSAALCALLYGQAFASDGWSLRPRLDVPGLPLHLVRADGDVTAKPCAEAVLGARAVERIVERGLMAVQSQKEGDAVRLFRLQSAAEPLAPLSLRPSRAEP
jgi:type VI secretion system protein ImpC